MGDDGPVPGGASDGAGSDDPAIRSQSKYRMWMAWIALLLLVGTALGGTVAFRGCGGSGSAKPTNTVEPTSTSTSTTTSTLPLYTPPPQYQVPQNQAPQYQGPLQHQGPPYDTTPTEPATPSTHVPICDPVEPHQPCVPAS